MSPYFLLILSLFLFSSSFSMRNPPEVTDPKFDIFSYLSQVKDDKIVFKNIAKAILKNFNDWESFFPKDSMNQFLDTLAAGYEGYSKDSNHEVTNYYHTILHAADVMQTVFVFILQSGSKSIIGVDTTAETMDKSSDRQIDLDYLTLIIAAAGHDYKHMGRDNKFYGNDSVKDYDIKPILKEFDYQLEPYHAKMTLQLINDVGLLKLLTDKEQERFKELIKQFIEGTNGVNNAKEGSFLKEHKDEIRSTEFEVPKDHDETKKMAMTAMLHAADISNPTKATEIYVEWSNRVNQEFCSQHLEEISLAEKWTNYKCVNNVNDFANGQKGFFKFVVNQFYPSFCEAFIDLEKLCVNIEKNKKTISNDETLDELADSIRTERVTSVFAPSETCSLRGGTSILATAAGEDNLPYSFLKVGNYNFKCIKEDEKESEEGEIITDYKCNYSGKVTKGEYYIDYAYDIFNKNKKFLVPANTKIKLSECEEDERKIAKKNMFNEFD